MGHPRWCMFPELHVPHCECRTEAMNLVTEIPAVGSFIQAVASELKETLSSKNEDYAPNGEFSNFEIAAEFAGVDVFSLILAQIGIKMTRINNLHNNGHSPNNESLRDSIMDLAGYAEIAAAWLDAVQADAAEDYKEI